MGPATQTRSVSHGVGWLPIGAVPSLAGTDVTRRVPRGAEGWPFGCPVRSELLSGWEVPWLPAPTVLQGWPCPTPPHPALLPPLPPPPHGAHSSGSWLMELVMV